MSTTHATATADGDRDLTLDGAPLKRQRFGRSAPRFRASTASQLDPIRGSPEFQVPVKHLAREIKADVDKLNLDKEIAKYSVLGTYGFHPREVLAVWIYASRTGVHEASKVAERMKTDAAYLLLSGGRCYSASKLRTFRREHGELFAAGSEQAVGMAYEAGLLNPEDLSVDSMRLEAQASLASMRTAARSAKRIEELEKVDVEALAEAERAEHDKKVVKHTEAVAHCEATGRTSYSTTNTEAVFMKFPGGASLPGHRITAVGAGVKERFIVSVLINATSQDTGLLEPAMRKARETLLAAGMPPEKRMSAAADAGYAYTEDLAFAEGSRDWLDMFIAKNGNVAHAGNDDNSKLFGRHRFEIHDDGSATCPAGTRMDGPHSEGKGYRSWLGNGCKDCPLKALCTTGNRRKIKQSPEVDRVHEAMRARMAEPDAKKRYSRRIATIEPVFSYLESTMGFRRASSRMSKTIHAEIMLKVLAYNLARLRAARPLRVVFFSVVVTPQGAVPLTAWTYVAGQVEPVRIQTLFPDIDRLRRS